MRNHANEGVCARRRALLACVGSMFAAYGCATPYQDAGIMGGFTVARLADNTFRVAFRGNGLTSRTDAEEMTLLRSAQAALDHGFAHFVIVDASTTISEQLTTFPATATTTGTVYGSGSTATLHATTTISGGDTLRVARPSTVNLIVCHKTRPAGAAVVYDAAAIMASLGPRYGVRAAMK